MDYQPSTPYLQCQCCRQHYAGYEAGGETEEEEESPSPKLYHKDLEVWEGRL